MKFPFPVFSNKHFLDIWAAFTLQSEMHEVATQKPRVLNWSKGCVG